MHYFYIVVILSLGISFYKNKDKTIRALQLTKKSLNNIFPQFLSLILLIMLVLIFIDKDVIIKILGTDSGFAGTLIAGILGAITLIPTIIAYPLAVELLTLGAGYTQITMFITALTTVGIITLGTEINYMGKKFAIVRNVISFISAFIISIIVSLIIN